MTGRAVGDTLQLDQGANAETVKIASIVTPAPAAPAPNVTLTSALTKNHLNGAAVYLPQVVDGKILQSQTLTPTATDPRLQRPDRHRLQRRRRLGAAADDARRQVIRSPKTIALNTLTVGKHTTTVSLQDSAGSMSKYTTRSWSRPRSPTCRR